MKEGFIKIHRKMLNWEWYNDKNTKELFLHLLLIANWQDSRFMGMEIKRGQTFTSLDRLAESLAMTRKSIRTSLTKLKRTHEVATEGHANGTLVTLIQYELYQTEGTPKGKQRAHERARKGHAKGTQGATIEEEEELKEFNKEDKEQDLILPFYSQRFSEAWKNWNEYRSEIKKPYKSAKSEQAALNALKEFSEDFSINLINRSISNQWQGLVFKDTELEFRKFNQNGITPNSMAHAIKIGDDYYNKRMAEIAEQERLSGNDQ